jgi:Family of unknown function (DUF6188)
MKVTVREDRWSLAVDNARVHRIAFDWAVVLSIGPPPGPTFDIRIEQPCILLMPDGSETLLIPDGDPVRLAPLLALVRRSAIRVDAFRDGHLELQLADGYLLSVPAAEDYEPWEISGSDGSRLISTPGGGVTTWEGMPNRS